MPTEPVTASGGSPLAEVAAGPTKKGIDRAAGAEGPADPAAPVAIIGAEDALEGAKQGFVEARMIPGGPERPATSPGRTGPAPPHSVSGKPASIARGSSCSSANVWTCGRVDVWTCGTIQESHGLLPQKPPGGDTLPRSGVHRTRAQVARQGIGSDKETSPPAKGGAESSCRPLWERREGAGTDFPAQSLRPDRRSPRETRPERFFLDPARTRTRLGRLRSGPPGYRASSRFPALPRSPPP